MSQGETSLWLDFYRFVVAVESSSPGLVDAVARDFSYFRRGVGRPDYRLELVVGEPPWEGLPEAPAAFFTPRNVCFTHDGVNYIDYYGRALMIRDSRAGRAVVHGWDFDLLHEIAFLFVLSTVGQALDRMGLHRVHALGIRRHGLGTLLLLPSGGGKSTTALALLRQPGFQLLGEDTPLIDRRGNIVPFPLRLGVRPGTEHGVDSQYVRVARRMEFDPKILIDLAAFPDRLGDTSPPDFLLVGERNLGAVSRVEPIPRRSAFRSLVKYMVVGLGVYQGLEFLLERGAIELVSKVGTVASRTRNALALVRRAKCHRFVMGRDRELNRRTLVEFLE